MVAIAFLFGQGVFEHYLGMSVLGMDVDIVDGIMTGQTEDTLGLHWKHAGMVWSGWVGMVLLWVAAVLTAVTGYDYFRKALPHLKD